MLKRKEVLIVLVCLACLVPVRGFAGMAVTDATSYTYYVEMLKKELEQIEKQVENIEAVQTVYDETKKVYGSLSGVYTKIKDYYDKYKEIRSRIAGDISTTQRYLQQYMDEAQSMEDYLNDAGYVDVEKILGDVFKDVRNPSNDTDIHREWPKRRAYRQAAIQSALKEAEQIIQALPSDMARLEALLGEIERTEDLKASQDLSNHFLGEILGVLQELKALLAKDVAAKQALQFQGVDGQDQSLVKYQKTNTAKMPQIIQTIIDRDTSGLDLNEF
ncbi:hypothetical protein [Pseudodesulfovibrio pelocollis]|uniref:hypothetical protein n=1 Tax=Pseudodesulfovibrio pelocollis TaxID=3051432 RepID=UPI00255A82F8|nr:hypothetical protein [Pseudodesulfovibrio sp. SB368]